MQKVLSSECPQNAPTTAALAVLSTADRIDLGAHQQVDRLHEHRFQRVRDSSMCLRSHSIASMLAVLPTSVIVLLASTPPAGRFGVVFTELRARRHVEILSPKTAASRVEIERCAIARECGT